MPKPKRQGKSKSAAKPKMSTKPESELKPEYKILRLWLTDQVRTDGSVEKNDGKHMCYAAAIASIMNSYRWRANENAPEITMAKVALRAGVEIGKPGELFNAAKKCKIKQLKQSTGTLRGQDYENELKSNRPILLGLKKKKGNNCHAVVVCGYKKTPSPKYGGIPKYELYIADPWYGKRAKVSMPRSIGEKIKLASGGKSGWYLYKMIKTKKPPMPKKKAENENELSIAKEMAHRMLFEKLRKKFLGRLKLVTDEFVELFKDYPLNSQYEKVNQEDILVIAKLFDSFGSPAWFLLEYDPKDKLALAYATGGEEYDFDDGLGYVRLEMFEEINRKLSHGMMIERDLKFVKKPLRELVDMEEEDLEEEDLDDTEM